MRISFNDSFTVVTMKFLYTNMELNLPHHLNYVAALPCFLTYSVFVIVHVDIIESCVRPSVCHVPRPNSRTERPRKPKTGMMEAHYMSNP